MNLNYSAIANDLKTVQFGCGSFDFVNYELSFRSLKDDLSLISSLNSNYSNGLSSKIDKLLLDFKTLIDATDKWCNNVTEVMYRASFLNDEIDAYDNLICDDFNKDVPRKINDNLIIDLTYMLSIGMFGDSEEEQLLAFEKMGYNKVFFEAIKENKMLNEKNPLFEAGKYTKRIDWVSPPDEILDTRMYNDFLSNSKYFNLVSNITNAESYKNYIPDSSDVLQKKIEAVKSVYGYTDDQMKTIFSIVSIEGISQGDKSNVNIYEEAVNVTSTALNRANASEYFGTSQKNPFNIFTANGSSGNYEYSAIIDRRFYQQRENTVDSVKQAVCDVLLSGVSAHNYDSYWSQEYTRSQGRSLNVLSEGGNSYFNQRKV